MKPNSWYFLRVNLETGEVFMDEERQSLQAPWIYATSFLTNIDGHFKEFKLDQAWPVPTKFKSKEE